MSPQNALSTNRLRLVFEKLKCPGGVKFDSFPLTEHLDIRLGGGVHLQSCGFSQSHTDPKSAQSQNLSLPKSVKPVIHRKSSFRDHGKAFEKYPRQGCHALMMGLGDCENLRLNLRIRANSRSSNQSVPYKFQDYLHHS